MHIVKLAKTLTIASLLLTLGACRTAEEAETAAVSQRSAEAIVADIDAAAYPTFDSSKRGDQEYIAQFTEQRAAVAAQRSELIGELYHADPDHDRIASLMAERWQARPNEHEKVAAVQAELKQVIADHGADTELGAQARYTRASMALNDVTWNDGDPDEALASIEKFITARPNDDRAAALLYQLAAYGYEGGSEKQIALLKRVSETYADSEDGRAAQSARSAEGQLRQLAGIGKPFDYSFTCAVTGSEYEPAVLKGKVVVIDFWATWCGPCIAEMPKMKDLYAKYHDQGVEFIGVSLDQPVEQGGLEKLLAYVKDNDVPWPQWYQGKGWQGEFSTKWGISGIPTLFIVDAEGNLRSTTARGKLEELIVELLEERDAATTRTSSL